MIGRELCLAKGAKGAKRCDRGEALSWAFLWTIKKNKPKPRGERSEPRGVHTEKPAGFADSPRGLSGYDLRGNASARCPECGTYNVPRPRG